MGICAAIAFAAAPMEKAVGEAGGVSVSIKMIGPATQATDLQIICILQHDPAGDTYIEAMHDLDQRLGGLLSDLRNRGDFVGAAGETLLLTPPAGAIAAKRLLLIGVGEEPKLTADKLRVTGRIAAREAGRLKVSHISWAPTLHDQGSTRIEVGEGDAAFATGFAEASAAEQYLAKRGLADPPSVADLTIEAGPKFFDSAATKVAAALKQWVDAADHPETQPSRTNDQK
jgi:hypothetical protein